MHVRQPILRPVPLAYKVLMIVLVAILLVIGLVGLILPIIPGILFLFLAALLLTRLSRRVKAWMYARPWFRRQMRYFRAAGALSLPARLKLGFLVTARATLNGLESTLALLRRKPRTRK